MLEGQKVSARNYVTQCETGLLERIKQVGEDDARSIRWFIGLLRGCQHFCLPDFGRIFDDDMKGLEGRDLRIPYPSVSLSYFVPYDKVLLTEEQPTYAPKRVIILHELDRETVDRNERLRAEGRAHIPPIPSSRGLDGDRFILMLAANFINDAWITMAASFLYPAESWQGQTVEGQLATKGNTGILLPGHANWLVNQGYSSERAAAILKMDIGPELRASMEFMEAMSCSNVVPRVHESAPKAAVNERRIKQGKPPLYETKVLAIDYSMIGGRSPSGGGGESGRASPRMHLRRGHFRRISEGRQIYIPAMVVGKREHGIIEKSYALQKGS